MCVKAVKACFFVFVSVTDPYKTQEICDEAVGNYAHELEFLPAQYKTQKMCDEVVHDYSSIIQFVSECYKTKEMCNKAVNTCVFFNSILFPINITLKNVSSSY